MWEAWHIDCCWLGMDPHDPHVHEHVRDKQEATEAHEEEERAAKDSAEVVVQVTDTAATNGHWVQCHPDTDTMMTMMIY